MAPQRSARVYRQNKNSSRMIGNGMPSIQSRIPRPIAKLLCPNRCNDNAWAEGSAAGRSAAGLRQGVSGTNAFASSFERTPNPAVATPAPAKEVRVCRLGVVVQPCRHRRQVAPSSIRFDGRSVARQAYHPRLAVKQPRPAQSVADQDQLQRAVVLHQRNH
jgi:hypothetical protein